MAEEKKTTEPAADAGAAPQEAQTDGGEAQALAKIDQKYHEAAKAIHAAYAIPWGTIVTIALELLMKLAELLEQPEAKAKKAGDGCPEHAKKSLREARGAATQTLVQVICAEHCLGCCDD